MRASGRPAESSGRLPAARGEDVHGERVSLHLDAAAAATLRTAARQNGCTLYMVLLAGFNLFLHRVAGQHAIVTGIPVTGRSVAGSERLAGYCTHLLPLRSTLPEQATVASFLAGTRQNLLDALEHRISVRRAGPRNRRTA